MTGVRETLSGLLRSSGAPVGELVDEIQAVEPSVRALFAGVAAMLETNVITGLLVPGDTVMLIASVGVRSVQEGVLLGAVVAVGAFVGEVSGYWLGRWVGSSLHRGRWLRRRVGERRLGNVGRMVMRHGGLWILTSRFMPILRTVTPFVVGLHGFPFRRFVAWAAPACVLWSTIFVTVYAVASSSLRDEDGPQVLGAALSLFGAALFVTAVLAQYLFQRHEGPEAVPSVPSP